jgi:hypothetical protein
MTEHSPIGTTATQATVRACQAASDLHYALNLAILNPPTFGYDEGKKYDRVWYDNGTQRFVAFFIERATGDVWKAAGWKAPTKNFVRGNVSTEEGLREFITNKVGPGTAYFYAGI